MICSSVNLCASYRPTPLTGRTLLKSGGNYGAQTNWSMLPENGSDSQLGFDVAQSLAYLLTLPANARLARLDYKRSRHQITAASATLLAPFHLAGRFIDNAWFFARHSLSVLPRFESTRN